jgi:phosphoglycerate dehydrogenase-like enzyme
MVREGRWTAGWPVLGTALSARRVVIIGLGGIGTAVAQRCAALGMTVGWWGPRAKDTSRPRAASPLDLADAVDALILT